MVCIDWNRVANDMLTRTPVCNVGDDASLRAVFVQSSICDDAGLLAPSSFLVHPGACIRVSSRPQVATRQAAGRGYLCETLSKSTNALIRKRR